MLLTWGSSQGLNALMNSAEFIAGFADKGSGEVDLTLAKGTGSATFTRATTATTVNSAGQIISVASGVARSYYDPTTLQYLGYLAEGARTNLCLQSADFATTWAATSTTVTANSTVAPDGTTTADTLNATASFGDVRQNISFTGDGVKSVSIFLKEGTATNTVIDLFDVSAATSRLGVIVDWTVSPPIVANFSGSGTIYDLVSYPNGWYRVSFAPAGVVAANTNSLRVYGAGALTGTVVAWGAQAENASFASTYIPTTTAAVTRNADVLTYPSSGNISGTVGTCYSEITSWSDSNSAADIAVVSSFQGGAEGVPLFFNGAANSKNFALYDGTAVRAFGSQTFPISSISKFAASWGGSTCTGARNGALVGSDQTFDGNLNLASTIEIGYEAPNTTLTNLFGTIRNVRIYQTQLSASQLQAVTA